MVIFFKKIFMNPFYVWGFKFLKATGPLQGESLPFTTKSPGVSGSNLIDFRGIKDWVDFGATKRFLFSFHQYQRYALKEENITEIRCRENLKIQMFQEFNATNCQKLREYDWNICLVSSQTIIWRILTLWSLQLDEGRLQVY